VSDLERSTAFYSALGFALNPAMSDHNASCFIVEEDHSFVMLLTREFFQTFTDLPLGDPAKNPSVSVAIYLDSREAVDTAAADGLAAGATEPRPASDYGFMYQRGLADPDGNIIEFGWFDATASVPDPEAAANQQA
jgi:predicted lactoylglutathione lyase